MYSGCVLVCLALVWISDIYSRGFSWLTDDTVFDTKLYLVQSDKGEQADFTNAIAFEGDTVEITYEKNGDFSTEGNAIPAYPHKIICCFELSL